MNISSLKKRLSQLEATAPKEAGQSLSEQIREYELFFTKLDLLANTPGFIDLSTEEQVTKARREGMLDCIEGKFLESAIKYAPLFDGV
jgi:hypothetical protein